MYFPIAQTHPVRCSLFTTRDVTNQSEYLIEVTEILFDLDFVESELELWRANGMGQ